MDYKLEILKQRYDWFRSSTFGMFAIYTAFWIYIWTSGKTKNHLVLYNLVAIISAAIVYYLLHQMGKYHNKIISYCENKGGKNAKKKATKK